MMHSPPRFLVLGKVSRFRGFEGSFISVNWVDGSRHINASTVSPGGGWPLMCRAGVAHGSALRVTKQLTRFQDCKKAAEYF